MELLADLLSNHPVVNPRSKYFHEVVIRLADLRSNHLLDLADVLQLTCGADDRLHIECRFGEFHQLWDGILVDIQQVEFKEWLLVHLVRRIQISEKLIDLTVSENGNSCTGDME